MYRTVYKPVEISGFSGSYDDVVMVTGRFFGEDKVKIFFEYVHPEKRKLKKAKCEIVKGSVMWNPTNGDSEFAFYVPRVDSKFQPLTGTLKIKNKGRMLNIGEFTIASEDGLCPPA